MCVFLVGSLPLGVGGGLQPCINQQQRKGDYGWSIHTHNGDIFNIMKVNHATIFKP